MSRLGALLLVLALLAACSGGSSSSKTTTGEREVADQPAAETCDTVGARAARQVAEDPELPKGLPANTPDRFGALITRVCTNDGWSAEVIHCGMIAEDPRKECRPLLSATQSDSLTAAQEELTSVLIAEHGVPFSDGPTSIAECDQLLVVLDALRTCPKLPKENEEALRQYREVLVTLPESPGEYRPVNLQACAEGLTGAAELAAQHGCTLP